MVSNFHSKELVVLANSFRLLFKKPVERDMERLFNQGGSYTDRAIVINTYVSNLLKQVMDLYPDVDMRDLTLVVLNAAQDACLCVTLDRKED